jgi:hypothetical protein
MDWAAQEAVAPSHTRTREKCFWVMISVAVAMKMAGQPWGRPVAELGLHPDDCDWPAFYRCRSEQL